MTREHLPFEQLVFSGGGLRCFWHGGWCEVVEARYDLRPTRITGVSGGALSAAAWISGRETFLLDRMARAFRHEDTHASPEELDPDHGRTSHQRVYDAVVSDVLDDAAQAKVADGPDFHICVSSTEDGALPSLRALIGGAAYELDKVRSKTPRAEGGRVGGIQKRMIDGRQAARDGRLHDLVRMAATVPPAFRIDTWDEAPIFDGGMMDQIPMPQPDTGPTLALLTRRYDALPDDEGGRIVFVEPSAPVLPGDKMNFTDPDLLGEAWRQGRRDGQVWLDNRV